ncbi:lectin, mannose-binding 2 [Nematocida minor]|uniref:lectin, mannose-binding 2 n=1 Tax=Nematocida minor TaxID=1912983 RepID=UPI00221E9745|nr:lectin, mannose-binding 2 [Nematocida minor]KAI5192935.1 lectin, mannose-binding 2 [Nematocida minor]
MNICVFLALLGILSVSCKEKISSTYKSKMSLFRPYIDRTTGRLPFGEMKGDCNVVSIGGDAGVHLTSSREGSSGSISSKHPLEMRNWKMDVHMQIKPGAKGAAIWIMKDFEAGDLFGGSSTFNGMMIFLALEKNNLTNSYPSIGIATAYGGAPVVHFEKKISFVKDSLISLNFWNGTLSVSYGGRDKKVNLVDELSRLTVDDGSFITVSGEIKEAFGDISVKTISLFRLYTSNKKSYSQYDPPKTRSLMTWVIFVILIGAVGYYLYKQRSSKPKHKGILQQ